MLSLRLFLTALIGTSFLTPSVSDAAELMSPSPLAPSAYITDTTPDFSWSLVDGASSYEFSLLDDNDSVVYFNLAGIDNPPFNIAGAVFDTSKVYHWKVRALSSSGAISAWSETESFLIFDPNIVPKTLGPVGYIQSSMPLFQWTEADGAVNYDLWIQNEAETETINFFGSVEGPSFQEPENMPFSTNQVYHYKVRSRLANGTTSLWSDPNSFLVYRQGDVPQLIGPSVQAPLGLTNFSWRPVESAAKYEIRIMNDAETAVILSDEEVLVNGYAPKAGAALELGVVYHWKVRSILNDGARSLWSETSSFVFYDPSIVPDGIMPFGYITSSRPLLEWSQVNGASSYQIQILDSLTQQPLATSTVASDTRLDLATVFKPKAGVSYDWRVKAMMADGRTSVWSARLAFRISKDIWSGLITGQRMSVHFYPKQIVKMNWNVLNLDGVTGLRYHVILRAQPLDGPFATLWSGDASPSEPGAITIPSDVYLRPSTTHAWVVQAFNVDGLMIGESRKYAFKTPAEVPARFQDEIAALQSAQAIGTDDLVASQTKAVADLASAQAARVTALSLSQGAALEVASQKTATRVSSLRASQAASVASLKKSQAAATASLEKSQAAASLNLSKTQATAVASLAKSQTSAMTALATSQASALVALKKVKGVTQAQIDQLASEQASAQAALSDSQAAARESLVAAQAAATSELGASQVSASQILSAAQAKAQSEQSTSQSAAFEKLQNDGAASITALGVSQGAAMAKFQKALDNQMVALKKRQAQQLSGLALKQQAALNKLLRAQEAELLRTR